MRQTTASVLSVFKFVGLLILEKVDKELQSLQLTIKGVILYRT